GRRDLHELHQPPGGRTAHGLVTEAGHVHRVIEHRARQTVLKAELPLQPGYGPGVDQWGQRAGRRGDMDAADPRDVDRSQRPHRRDWTLERVAARIDLD